MSEQKWTMLLLPVEMLELLRAANLRYAIEEHPYPKEFGLSELWRATLAEPDDVPQVRTPAPQRRAARRLLGLPEPAEDTSSELGHHRREALRQHLEQLAPEEAAKLLGIVAPPAGEQT